MGATVNRNDLIVIEFSNPSSRAEVLLEPAFIGELANVLTQGLQMLLPRPDPSEQQVRLKLAAIKEGSLILGFLPEVFSAAGIGVTADIVTIVTGFILIGQTQGYFKPKPPADTKQIELDLELQRIARDRQLLTLLATLTKQLSRPGAEQVTISAYDLPEYLVDTIDSFDVRLIGSRADKLDVQITEYKGLLKRLRGPFGFKSLSAGNDPFSVYAGDIEWEGEDRAVVVRWHSRRNVEDALASAEPVTVEGLLQPIRTGEWESPSPIPADLLPASAELGVRKQIIVTAE